MDVALAVIGAAIPSIGMASNGFHYFTDIIGGAFYATGMVCLAVLAAGLSPAPFANQGRLPLGKWKCSAVNLSRRRARQPVPPPRPEKMQPPRKVPSSAR